MERGSSTLSGTLRLHAVCAFLGALATLSGVVASRYVGGGLMAALIYAAIAWFVTSNAVRRAAIAIEASECGLKPWLRLIQIASVVGYGAIAAFVLLAPQQRHTYPDNNTALGVFALVGILLLFGSLPEAAARSLASEEQQRSLNGLLGGRSPGAKTTSAQGHRIGRGGAAPSQPTAPQSGGSGGKKASPGRRRWFGKKPAAPSPFESVFDLRDLLK